MKRFFLFFFFYLLFSNSSIYSAHGTVEGTVVDASTLLPIEGATVNFYRPGGIFEGSATTDSSGYYTWERDPHNYIMTVVAEGYQTVTLSIKIQSNQTITVDVSMTGSPGTITGAVTGPPAGSTTLTLYLNNTAIATTTTSGTSYTFANLSPGSYVVTASSSGYQTQAQGATVVAGGVTVVNFTLLTSFGNLEGYVTDGANPINNALVQVSSGGIVIAYAATNPLGYYSILGLAPGNYTATASAIGYGQASQGISIVATETTQANFVLAVSPGTLYGMVTDNLNNPLSSCMIELNQNNIPIMSTFTGIDGKYNISGIAPGYYVVHAHDTGYQIGIQGVTIVAATASEVNFILNPDPGSLAGFVYDNSSNPLSGVLVEVNYNNVVIFSTLTASDGSYLIQGIGPGAYVIHAHDPGYQSGIQSALIVSDKTTTLNFYLNPDPGSLDGFVYDSSSNPLSGVLVEVNYNNVVIFSTLTASDGSYLIQGIAPGAYVIHAHDPGYQTGIQGAVIVSDQTTIANFTLDVDQGLNISGYVYDYDTSEPISGAFLQIFFKSADEYIYLGSYVTNGLGYYIFEQLPNQMYKIIVRKSGYFPQDSFLLTPTTTQDFYLKTINSGPVDLIGEKRVDTFLLQADRIHRITWKASLSARVVAYNVYVNGVFAVQIPEGAPFEFTQHNCPKNKAIIYKVQTVFDDGFLGGFSEVTLR